MATQKDVKNRIASIKNINKITRAMEMVAAAWPRRLGIALTTGARGLAGAFNTNIIRDGLRLRGEIREQGKEAVFSAVGRKGVSALTFRQEDPRTSYTGFPDRPGFANAREIGEELN